MIETALREFIEKFSSSINEPRKLNPAENNIFFIIGIIAVIQFAVVMLAYTITNKRVRSKTIINFTNSLILGIFLSSWLLIGSIYFFGNDPTVKGNALITFFAALQHTFRLFAFDGDYFMLMGMMAENVSGYAYKLYVIAGAFVYVAAPIMTLSFILKLVKNLSANIRYCWSFRKDAHIFSELNERSLALAKNIRKNSPKERIVFADIIDKNEEAHTDLVDEAKAIGAILFRKDLKTISFCRFGYQNKERKNGDPKRARKINFYLISYDENEKITHANHIRETYDWKNVYLYVFSNDVSCEMIMSTKNQRHIKIARINDIQALIYHNLDEYGIRLFQNAALKNDYTISAVIVGLGKYGFEMLKALTWFCQFPGFNLKIEAFDSDPNAKKRVEAMCPELISHSGKKISGDAEYTIHINSGINVESSDFINMIEEIDDATFVFVCLGEDKKNLAAAKRLRETYEYMKIYPDIETVVYDSDTSEKINYKWDRIVKEDERGGNGALASGVKNHKSAPYRIHTIGDLETFYSVDTLPLENENNKKGSFGYLVTLGEKIDDRWGKSSRENAIAKCNELLEKLTPETEKTAQLEIEDIAREFILDLDDINKNKDIRNRLIYLKELINENSTFWRFEYNYRSSVAKALHKELRKQMIELVDGSDVNPFEKSISKNSEVRVHLNLGCPKGKDNESFNRVFEALKQTHLPEITRYAINYIIAEEREREKAEAENAKTSPFDSSMLCRMDLLCIGELEHRRWNAYMRTEGYRSCAKDGTRARNDLGKIHNNICSSYQLDDKTLENDI